MFRIKSLVLIILLLVFAIASAYLDSSVLAYILPKEFGVNSQAETFLPVVISSNVETSAALIIAKEGGDVRLGSNTLSIPPGALDKDTYVTLRRPVNGLTLEEHAMTELDIQPSGLVLNKPAILTFSYQDTFAFDEKYLQVWTFNDKTNQWEYEVQVDHNKDKITNYLSVLVSRFSFRLVYADEPLYLVMEIPGKFLQPGDILYALTVQSGGLRTWIPGHVGMYSSSDTSGKSYIVEANQFGDDNKCGLGFMPGGVRDYPMEDFQEEHNHIYMGARSIDAATREDKAVAHNYAYDKIAKAGYSVVGQGNFREKCFSCVGLAEAAYDYASNETGNDFDIIIPAGEIFPITPFQHFKNTQPVDEIIVNVGEKIKIPIKSVVKVPRTLQHDYYVYGGIQSILNKPDKAQFSDGVFSWTPTAADTGKHTVTFGVSAYAGEDFETRSQSLTIVVEQEPSVGPLTFDSIELFDNNTNEFAGCGQSVGVEMGVLVQGNSNVDNVCATLSTSDSFTVVEDSQYFPSTDCHPWDYTPGELIGLDYGFDVSAGAPDGHVIDFNLDMTADNGGPWHDEFTVVVACPDN